MGEREGGRFSRFALVISKKKCQCSWSPQTIQTKLSPSRCLRYRRSDFFSCFLKRLLASTCFPPNRCMVKQIFALLFVAIFLSPSFTTSVTGTCVTPVCRCSSYSSYNVTVICYTDDVKYDLNRSIKKPEEIVALYVNSYDSLFYILSSSSLSFFFVIA